MLKKARYWKAFTATTRAKAEQAAAAWWAEQSGFDRISGWTLPAGQPADATPGWTVTIIYKPSDPQPRPTTVH